MIVSNPPSNILKKNPPGNGTTINHLFDRLIYRFNLCKNTGVPEKENRPLLRVFSGAPCRNITENSDVSTYQ